MAGEFLSLKFAPNRDAAKLGVSITKKHVRRAVRRNRFRRVLKENFRQDKNAPPFDLLVTSLPTLKNATADEVRRDFRALLEKINRFRKRRR